jgi:AcrR family transcriptional regulator
MPKRLSPARGRPPLSHDQLAQTREAIAAAARRVFLAEGYESVSMRRLASEVGCTPMAIYTYYDSKIDILRQLWAEVFEAVFAKVERAGAKSKAPAVRLKAMCRAYVRYWLEHPDRYRMVFMSAGVTQGDVTVFVENDAIAARYNIFASALSACTGRAHPRLAKHAQTLICGMIGVAHSHITVSGYPWSSADALVVILVDGILLSATND